MNNPLTQNRRLLKPQNASSKRTVTKFKYTALATGIAMALSGPSYADLDDGLVAYYPFSGNANDASGNGNHGTVDGATLTTGRSGYSNCAYHFDGQDDFIEVPNTNNVFDLTDSWTPLSLGTSFRDNERRQNPYC